MIRVFFILGQFIIAVETFRNLFMELYCASRKTFQNATIKNKTQGFKP